MSVLAYIDGAPWPEFEVAGVGPALLQVGVGLSSAHAYGAAQVQGNHLTRASETVAVGQHVADDAAQVLQVGFTATVTSAAGRALGLITVNGEFVRRALETILVNGQRPSSAASAPLGLTVGSSWAVKAAARQANQVSGESVGRSRLSHQVRGEFQADADMALETKRENTYKAQGSAALGGYVTGRAGGAAEIVSGDSFLILADVMEEALAVESSGVGGSAYYRSQEIYPRLTVNGTVWPISSFNYSKPRGRLGAALNVRLAQARTLPASVAPLMSVTFELGLRGSDGTLRWKALMEGGRLAGRNISIAFRPGANPGPQDEFTISAIDIESDRFGLAPRQPVIMYDPWKVKAHEVEVKVADALRNEQGGAILPVVEPVAGLTAYQAMNRAYTSLPGTAMIQLSGFPAGAVSVPAVMAASEAVGYGIGFDRVVTNIEDYPISRCDFSVEGGWHEGAQRLFAMYGPLYFVQNNVLFIIDPNRALPAGFTPKLFPVSVYARLQISTVPSNITNAVVLTYKADAWEIEQESGVFFTERTDDPEISENGEPGEHGYTKTTTVRKWKELRHADEPFVVISDVEILTTVETMQTFITGDNTGHTTLRTHKETTQNFYDGMLKTGHDKSVQGLIRSGFDASYELVEVLREKCSIAWKLDTNNPNQYLQDRCTTQVHGLAYRSEDTVSQLQPDGSFEDVHLYYPALVSQASGIITSDGHMGWLPIKTIEEVLTPTKGQQVDMHVRVYNHLTGTVDHSTTAPRTGSRASGNDLAGKARSVLIRDLASEADIGPRIPAGINAGELPRDRALQLGRDTLAFILAPEDDVHLDLAGYDVSVHKGLVLRAQTRDGQTDSYMVAGFDIRGENLGQRGHRISMSLDSVKIVT